MSDNTIYEILGGYDGVAAFANVLVKKLHQDEVLGRFWTNRGTDGIEREKKLLIDYLCQNLGGQVKYLGREMKVVHSGMRITNADWQLLMGYLSETLDELDVGRELSDTITTFIENLKHDVVDD